MSERRILKEIDIQTIKAEVLMSDGSRENVVEDGYCYIMLGSSLYVQQAEELFKRRIKNNILFQTTNNTEIFGRYITKILSKKIEPKIVKVNEVWTKFLFFPETFSHYEEIK